MRDNIYNVRSGVAPVISSLIITAAVLSIGSMIWSFSLGAATVTADIYVNDTLDMLNEMKERFNVENAYYDTTVDELRIWVFNYGEVDIKVAIYVSIDSAFSELSESTFIEAGNTVRVDIDFSLDPISPQEQVAIKVYSRRGNLAYYSYYVQ